MGTAATKKRRGYVLYGSRNSGSAAIEAALDMAKAPYRIVDAATWRKKDDADSFAQLQRVNPLHRSRRSSRPTARSSAKAQPS